MKCANCNYKAVDGCLCMVCCGCPECEAAQKLAHKPAALKAWKALRKAELSYTKACEKLERARTDTDHLFTEVVNLRLDLMKSFLLGPIGEQP